MEQAEITVDEGSRVGPILNRGDRLIVKAGMTSKVAAENFSPMGDIRRGQLDGCFFVGSGIGLTFIFS